MTGGERYLERQAKRTRREYLESPQLSPRLPTLDLHNLPLRDAPPCFRDRFHEILHAPSSVPAGARNTTTGADDDNEEEEEQLGKVVFSSVNMSSFDAAARASHFECGGGHAATIIGSSQQGKTTLLNSLLNLFGFFHHPGELTFPHSNLLPSHSQHGIGLPFPVKLEYGPRYEVHLQRWDPSGLQDLMWKVATQALEQDSEVFEDLMNGFGCPREGSFMEFMVQNSSFSSEAGFSPAPSAIESLQADGTMERKDDFLNADTDDIHQAVREFLIKLVMNGRWFCYEYVTIKCPSQLLKHLRIASDSSAQCCILDLPGIGIIDDDNLIVEELVFRDVREAGTVIILTGERNFTQDIVKILKEAVFQRLLDPLVMPRPTVAITNSRNLRGLKEEEMDTWRSATLHGSLGWETELKAYAEEAFLTGNHRQLESLEPDLFPNDLEGFLTSRSGAHEKGISMLAGYFLRLPQEALIAGVADVLERARSVIKMIDQLWKAQKVSWKGLRSSRLMKEAKRLRDEQFSSDLDVQFNPTAQRQVFGFERERTIDEQKQLIHQLFHEQKQRLAQWFKQKDKEILKQDVSKLMKDALLHIASQWDEEVGQKAFNNFLSHGERTSMSLYQKWAKSLFHSAGRGGSEDESKEQACKLMVNYMNATALATIRKGTFKYTLTNGLRSQAWNLDLKDITKIFHVRKRRGAPATYNQVYLLLVELLKNKEASFRQQMLEHMKLHSQAIQEFVRLMKEVIKNTFEECEHNFDAVMDALEKIATGKLAISKDPVVILREELETMVKEGERYLARHKESRDSFGAQELRKVLKLQSLSLVNT